MLNNTLKAMLKPGTCKLCLQLKALLNESHIIPKFIYKRGGFDISQKIKVASFDHKTHKIKEEQSVTTIYEKEILCEDCDNNRLGRNLEDYACKVMFSETLSPKLSPVNSENVISPNGIKVNIFDNIDYKKLKLFILSILWRASISKHPFFSGVDLGDKHEESIRKLIYENDAKAIDDYPILITSWWHSKISTDVIIRPVRLRFKNGYRYRLIIAGLIFDIFISSDIFPQEMLEYTIRPDGKISVIQLNDEFLTDEVTFKKYLLGLI